MATQTTNNETYVARWRWVVMDAILNRAQRVSGLTVGEFIDRDKIDIDRFRSEGRKIGYEPHQPIAS